MRHDTKLGNSLFSFMRPSESDQDQSSQMKDSSRDDDIGAIDMLGEVKSSTMLPRLPWKSAKKKRIEPRLRATFLQRYLDMNQDLPKEERKRISHRRKIILIRIQEQERAIVQKMKNAKFQPENLTVRESINSPLYFIMGLYYYFVTLCLFLSVEY